TTGDVPDEWAFQLFDDDYDHFGQHMEAAMRRVPALESAGVKRMINGPESFTPDGNFILGAAPECENMFVGAGFNAFGIASGGGAGWVLAEWVATGEAPLDLWPVDIRRFSDLQKDREWVCERTCEAYGKHYTIAYPHTEMESGRPRITSPLYQRLRDQGAVFGSKLGWERPNWFAKNADNAQDIPSMGHQNWSREVGQEHALVREAAGLFDQSSFAKFEVTGPAAAAALDHICAGDIDRPPGFLTYTQILNSRGGIEADLTVARLADDHFYIVTGTGFRTHDFGWISDRLPKTGASIEDVTEAWGTLSLMGPRARDILERVTPADISNESFPFGQVRTISVNSVELRALRVSYVGELGWELHIPIAQIADVYDALMDAGAQDRLAPVGYRALECLRLEKGYRAWSSDITPNDTPFEAGLGWATKMKSNRAFIGRDALELVSNKPLAKRLAGFIAPPDTVLLGRETILRDGKPVGYLTSGGFGHTLGSAIGYGYIRNPDGGGVDEAWISAGSYTLDVAGDIVPAEVGLRPFYDPGNVRLKS
ncbi:MAG: FAD-dependent oxidoreductase, partial [Pseudomonadota bacterium]